MERYSIAYLGQDKWACIERTPDDAPIVVDSDDDDNIAKTLKAKMRLDAIAKQMEELEKEKAKLLSETSSRPAKRVKTETAKKAKR